MVILTHPTAAEGLTVLAANEPPAGMTQRKPKEEQ
jgi:hypothetical protein